MRLSATRLTSLAQAGGGRTPTQRAISILRRFGPDAHIYLPGVGMLNGLQAGNYIDSAGTTPGTVDQPVGLVLDAAGGLGVDLVAFPYVARGTVSGTTQFTLTTTSVATTEFGVVVALPLLVAVAGKSYRITSRIVSKSVVDPNQALTAYTSASQNSGVGAQMHILTAGGHSSVYAPASTSTITVRTEGGTATIGDSWVIEFSIREVTGIHAQQPTTANKSVLKLTNGRYNWLFDSTDLLTATYPAGYESVTVIDARSTGQVTTAGANIVGSYSMGPGVTLYGRMVIKGALSASELALLQSYANRLAGL